MSRTAGVLDAKAPALSRSDAARVAENLFGVRLETLPAPLESERDQNFRLTSDRDGDLVLKLANPAEDPAVLDFQNRALQHVAERDPGLCVPRLQTFRQAKRDGRLRSQRARSRVALP